MSWRIEPQPRSDDIEAGLAARVHDPLWLLARQWQLGEFNGRDAGTPTLVRAQGSATPVNAWRGAAQAAWTAFDAGSTPLDALIEPEDEAAPDLRERIEAGAHFLRLLAATGLQRYAAAFVAAHAFTLQDLADPAFAADPLLAAVARRQPDGLLLLPTAQSLSAGAPSPVVIADAPATTPPQPEGGPAAGAAPPVVIAPGDAAAVAIIATQWLEWYAEEIAPLPGAGTAVTWLDNQLEYGFSVSSGAGGGTVLRASAYHGDGLDWFDFDIDTAATAAPGTAPIAIDGRAVPTPVRYGGMPLPRFWAMEDARYDFGAVDATASDVARLLLIEFATVYGNNWFVLPVKLPLGSLTLLDSVVVTDVFGRHLKLDRAGDRDPAWSLYTLAAPASAGPPPPAARALFLPPTAGAVMEGEPLETVEFLRDPMADMAFGVEGLVEDALGRRIDRRAAWVGHWTPPPGDPAQPSYRVETVVPDYWIPLAPEQDSPDEAVRLRLVPMAVDEGGPQPRVLMPRGRVLAPQDPAQGLWLHEEEVPREGTRLDRIPRYARWQFGRTTIWTARRRQTGRGEGSSGLRFDVLDPG